MPLKIAIQLDPLVSLNPKTDTSLLLAHAAQQRGYSIMYFHPQELSMRNGEVIANARELIIEKTSQGPVGRQGKEALINLREVDVVLIRQNPPFDMAYITGTYLLEQITNDTLVLNHPRGIRNAAEKLLPLHFLEFMPPTLISQNWEQIAGFCHQHGDIIIKPLYDYGGHSVFRSTKEDGQLKALFDLLRRSYPNLPFIVQPFLEKVIEGDKRITLIEGEIVGAFSRVPIEGEIRGNMLMGGTPKPCDLDKNDLAICQALKPTLQEMGLFLVGLDIIDKYLIEINVTSPTGLVALNKLNNQQSENIFWDKVEEMISK